MQTHKFSRVAAYFAFAVAGLLWAVPLFHPLLGFQSLAHDYERVFEVAVLPAAAILWAVAPSRARKFDLHHWLLSALAILITASCAAAPFPHIAAREVALFGGLVVLALALSESFSEPRIRDRFLDILAVGAAVYGAQWLIALLIAGAVQSPFAPWDLLAGFDNPRFLNHAQSIALPLAGLVLLRGHAPLWVRVAAVFSLFAGGMILTLYLARASILGMMVGAIATMLFVGWKSKRYVVAMASCLGVGALAMGLGWMWWYRFLTAPMTDGVLNVHFRDYLAARGIQFFLSSPWLGIGPMHFAQSSNPIAAHPHNIYVQALTEFGAPATALLAWFAGRGLRQAALALRAGRGQEPELVGALVSATVAMLVDGAFSGNFVMPISQMWCAVVIALLIAEVRRQRDPPHPEGRGDTQFETPVRFNGYSILRWSFVVALLIAGGFALREAASGDEVHLQTGQPKRDSTTEQLYNPRFWAHGWF